jgi:hypothetical protein
MGCVPVRHTIENGKIDTLTFQVNAGEPVFILRGQDALAAELVLDWANRAKKAGAPEHKWREAFFIYRDMSNWKDRKIPD